jgi:SAM-dependent methyltransferase
MGKIQDRASRLANKTFTGGPPDQFERVGRMQLAVCVEEGLEPQHRFLDIGCGALRAGYWIMHFLNAGCYFGLEPNREMVEAGIEHILDEGQVEEKLPVFTHNSEFDFGAFDEVFDVMLARSIWTHASKQQISQMLAGFRQYSQPTAFFLASYIPAGSRKRRALPFATGKHKDYRGDSWVGISHDDDQPGIVAHSLDWIQEVCDSHSLVVRELDRYEANGQRWLRVTHQALEVGS